MKKLIDKYYSGETSLAEEKRIRRYFAETAVENIPEDIREHAPLFMFFNLEVDKMGGSIAPKKPVFRWRYFYRASSVVAASLIIGLMVYFGTTQNDVLVANEVYLTVNGEKIYDEDAVKEFTQKQLLKVSNMMGKADNCFSSVGDMSDAMEKTFSKLNKKNK